MFNQNNGYSLADIAAATGNNNNGGFAGNDSSWWVIILFLFCFAGWGNGGYAGGFGGGQTGTSVYEGYVLNNDFSVLSNQMTQGFATQERKLDGISNGICSLGYDQLAQMNGINTNIMGGVNTLQAAINGVQSQLASCC